MEYNLFPINVYKDNIDNNQFLKEKYLPKIEERKDFTITPDSWTTTFCKTSYQNTQDNLELFTDSDLKHSYNNILSSFLDLKRLDIHYQTPWFNYYSDGEYQEAHTHVSSAIDYACIHYLQFDPERHSPLTLLDPSRSLKLYTHPTASYNFRLDLDINEGDLIMIPGYLEHEVVPGEPTPDYPRVTISFNIKVVKKESEPTRQYT